MRGIKAVQEFRWTLHRGSEQITRVLVLPTHIPMRNYWSPSERRYLLTHLDEAAIARENRQVVWHEEAGENLTPIQAFRYDIIMDLKKRFPNRFDAASPQCWSIYRIATLDSRLHFFYQNALRPERLRKLRRKGAPGRKLASEDPNDQSEESEMDNEISKVSAPTREEGQETGTRDQAGQLVVNRPPNELSKESDRTKTPDSSTCRRAEAGACEKQVTASKTQPKVSSNARKRVFLGVYLPAVKKSTMLCNNRERSGHAIIAGSKWKQQKVGNGVASAKIAKRKSAKGVYASELPLELQPQAASGSGSSY